MPRCGVDAQVDWPREKIVNAFFGARSIMRANKLEEYLGETTGAKVAAITKRCSLHEKMAGTLHHCIFKMNLPHTPFRKVRGVGDRKSYEFALKRGWAFRRFTKGRIRATGTHKRSVHSRCIFARPASHAGRCCCKSGSCINGKLLKGWSGEGFSPPIESRILESWTRSTLPVNADVPYCEFAKIVCRK